MCLYTKWIKPRVAKEDIKVYKLLTTKRGKEIIVILPNGTLQKAHSVSLRAANWNNHKYSIGKLYKVNGLGFTRNGNGRNSHTVDQGFHSFKNFGNVRNRGGAVECVIPKGSLYYEGTNNGSSEGYCSNQLIVVKPV